MSGNIFEVREIVKKYFCFIVLLASITIGFGFRRIPATRPNAYSMPRATFAKIHIGMSEDSVLTVFRSYAVRKQVLQADSLTYIETDSINILGQPAYLQAQILHKRVRTIVINFHPLAGDRYLNIRDQVDQYLQRLFGRGIEETDESMTHHRWETEEGTMEVTHSDKYTRVFIRLGKQRN